MQKHRFSGILFNLYIDIFPTQGQKVYRKINNSLVLNIIISFINIRSLTNSSWRICRSTQFWKKID